MSILSYPERGPWGNNKYRGNCSGHIYRDLFAMTKPKIFIDAMVGGGTSIQVANELGIESYGLDLHSGFNVLRDSIVQTVGKQADLVGSHPPYSGMIIYSGEVYGKAHPDDLSRCHSDEDFHEKLQVALLNQREATKENGYYFTIIGDWRRKGVYTSYQAECIARMPSDELAAVLIKQQHNTMSDKNTYRNLTLPRIMHEYVIIWQKRSKSTYFLLSELACKQSTALRATWRGIIRNVVMSLGGKAALPDIYQVVSMEVPDRVKNNDNWKAKVRQILNSNKEYFSDQRGVWQLSAST